MSALALFVINISDGSRLFQNMYALRSRSVVVLR
jgi:hypothetical protein